MQVHLHLPLRYGGEELSLGGICCTMMAGTMESGWSIWARSDAWERKSRPRYDRQWSLKTSSGRLNFLDDAPLMLK